LKAIIDYPKKGKFRKVNIVVHSKDLWCAHVTLAHVIYPVLLKIRKQYESPTQLTSFPASFLPPDDTYHDMTDEQYKPIENAARQKWFDALDTMLYAFYWIKTDDTFGPCGPAIHKELDEAVRIAKKYKKFTKHDIRMDAYGPVFEKWKPQLTAHEEKIKEGLRLFAEYYQSLWT